VTSHKPSRPQELATFYHGLVEKPYKSLHSATEDPQKRHRRLFLMMKNFFCTKSLIALWLLLAAHVLSNLCDSGYWPLALRVR
jgi:hypothetical protein